MANKEESGVSIRNKLGVCYVAPGIKEQLTKIAAFKRSCKIYDSDDIFPCSCHLPLLSISFLFLDFETDFKDWTGDKEEDQEKILELANFVKNSSGQYFHLVYLCSSVDAILTSIAYGVERSVKKQLGNPNALLFYGVAKTWRGAVTYMLDVSKNHWIDSLDQQHSDFQRDFDYLKVVMEKVENEGKQLINLHRFTNGDPFSELSLTDDSDED